MNTATVNREVVKTDKRYRRNLFIVYLGCIALGLAVWKIGVPRLLGYLDTLPAKSLVEVLEVIAHGTLLLFIPAAIYLIIIGKKVCRYKAMPYPGMKVIRDTVVVHGKRAQVRGWSLIILGMIMIIMVFISIVATHLIILRMKRHPVMNRIFYSVEYNAPEMKFEKSASPVIPFKI